MVKSKFSPKAESNSFNILFTWPEKQTYSNRETVETVNNITTRIFFSLLCTEEVAESAVYTIRKITVGVEDIFFNVLDI